MSGLFYKNIFCDPSLSKEKGLYNENNYTFFKTKKNNNVHFIFYARNV